MSEPIEVLIVEDDVRIVEINRRFLEKMEGFRVIGTATTGEEAKEMIAVLHPQLVLLDVYLPDMLGSELVWHIRQHHRNVDIIMVTAAKEIGVVQDALRGGVFDYIIKPLVFEHFRQRLELYREQVQRVQGMATVDQEEVDRLLSRRYHPESMDVPMPKGIDKLTLDKVVRVVKDARDTGMTAEEVATRIGVSRITARRYLEFLVQEGKAEADLVYGTVGRPERRYLFRT